MNLRVAIVGASGAVGMEFLNLFQERNFPVTELRLLASSRSAGKKVDFRGEQHEIQELKSSSFTGIDIAFFSAGAERSKSFIPHAVNAGAVAIDNSSAFRLDEDVPLVVPECNPEDALRHRGIIANPNCSTIAMVVALKPLLDAVGVKRVSVATYQAVSGSGAAALAELRQQTSDYAAGITPTAEVYPTQILFNVIPQVDFFLDNGYTKEEMKMVYETQKILHNPQMRISATCARVSVARCHSEAIQVETEKKITAGMARRLFEEAGGIQVIDDQKPGGYPMPLHLAHTFDTYVGRIREDISLENGISFWCVSDQLYKGAALNSLQIAEYLIEQKKL